MGFNKYGWDVINKSKLKNFLEKPIELNSVQRILWIPFNKQKKNKTINICFWNATY